MSVSPARRCTDFEEVETEPSAALRISNLPIRCDINLLRQTFERWGLVTECCIKGGYIPSVCYAFVEFGSIEDSTAAKTHFDLPDADPINGRKLCVRWARSKSSNIRKSDVQKTPVQKTTVEVFFSFKKSDVTDKVLYEDTVSALVQHLIPNATVVDVAIKSYNLCHFTDGITYSGHGHVLFPRTQAAVAMAFHLLMEHSNVAVDGLQFNFRVADQSFPCVLRDEPQLLHNRPDLREALKMLLRLPKDYKKENATVVTSADPLPLVSASEINIPQTLSPSPTNRTLNQTQRQSASPVPVGLYSPPRNTAFLEEGPPPYPARYQTGMMSAVGSSFPSPPYHQPQQQLYFAAPWNIAQHSPQPQVCASLHPFHSYVYAPDGTYIHSEEVQQQVPYHQDPQSTQYQQYHQNPQPQLPHPLVYSPPQSQLRVAIPAYQTVVPPHYQHQAMHTGYYYYQQPAPLSPPPHIQSQRQFTSPHSYIDRNQQAWPAVNMTSPMYHHNSHWPHSGGRQLSAIQYNNNHSGYHGVSAGGAQRRSDGRRNGRHKVSTFSSALKSAAVTVTVPVSGSGTSEVVATAVPMKSKEKEDPAVTTGDCTAPAAEMAMSAPAVTATDSSDRTTDLVSVAVPNAGHCCVGDSNGRAQRPLKEDVTAERGRKATNDGGDHDSIRPTGSEEVDV